MKEQWNSKGSVEEKWDVMKSALCESASSILGSARKRQADWFRKNEVVLKPLFEESSILHALWLSTGMRGTGRCLQGHTGLPGEL